MITEKQKQSALHLHKKLQEYILKHRSGMTHQQEIHLDKIKTNMLVKVDRKYRAGQLKHGGNLWDRNPVKELSQEITDAVTYMHCIEERDKLLQFGLASIVKLLEKPDKLGVKSAKKIAQDLLKELSK